MNKLLFQLFIAFFFFTSLPAICNYNETVNDYQLVWEDTFQGTTLNDDYWSAEVNGDGGGNNELQYYRRENISVGIEPQSGENCLIITARKENYSGRACTSGRLRTFGKVSFKYGKLEARIRLPKTANGLWPAFWMMGADYAQVGWPKCGEIDILEMGNADGIKNGTQDRFFGGHFHWGEKWPHPNWGKSKTSTYSIQDDFHLFTMIWDAKSIKMYLDLDKYPDNQPYVEMGITGSANPGDVARYFHKPFNVLFNMAIGGDYTGIHNINNITALNEANAYEAKMYVDYVRLYQKGDEGEELHVSGASALYENKFEKSFAVYPNPAVNELYITGNETPDSVLIYSMSGIKCYEAFNTSYVDMSSLPTGSYIIKIEHNGCVETYKLNKL